MPFLVTYNPVLPNIKEIINKHWNILSINRSFKETYNNVQPMVAFRENVNLKQLIGINKIKSSQNVFTYTQTATTDQCTPCSSIDRFPANKFSK